MTKVCDHGKSSVVMHHACWSAVSKRSYCLSRPRLASSVKFSKLLRPTEPMGLSLRTAFGLCAISSRSHPRRCKFHIQKYNDPVELIIVGLKFPRGLTFSYHHGKIPESCFCYGLCSMPPASPRWYLGALSSRVLEAATRSQLLHLPDGVTHLQSLSRFISAANMT